MVPFRGFAILAPVPVRHLISGCEYLDQTQLEFLAFGSLKIKENTSLRMLEGFQEIDQERDGQPVALLIYPSKEGTEEKPPYQVCWAAWYIGHKPATGDGLHPASDPWKYRPPTCRDGHDYNPDRERWSFYWHAAGLRQLPEQNWIDLTSLQREPLVGRAKPWPQGPERVTGEGWQSILDTLPPPPVGECIMD